MGQVRQFLWVVAGIMLAGACGPEAIDPPESNQPEQSAPETVTSVMRDGFYKLADGPGLSFGADLTLRVDSYGEEITTSEITSTTVLDHVEYLKLTTNNSVGFGMGWYFGFATTTGTGYGCMTYGDSIEWRVSTSTASSRLYPPGMFAIEPSEDGTLVWGSGLCSALDGCGYSPVGWVEFWNDATGFTLHIESEISRYVLDKTVSTENDAEVFCSTENRGCKIRKYVEPD